MKFLFAILMMSAGITAFGQVVTGYERVGFEMGTRMGTDGENYDQDFTAGLLIENTDYSGSFRVILPINSQLTKDQFNAYVEENRCGTSMTGVRDKDGDCRNEDDLDGKKYLGAEFMGLYKVHDRLGIGGVAGVYFVNDLNAAQGILGPAARVKLISSDRFDSAVEGRYNLATQRWEMGGTIVLGPKEE